MQESGSGYVGSDFGVARVVGGKLMKMNFVSGFKRCLAEEVAVPAVTKPRRSRAASISANDVFRTGEVALNGSS